MVTALITSARPDVTDKETEKTASSEWGKRSARKRSRGEWGIE